MSKSACKCKKPGECEECPEWIFTFADLVMLMMGFFVILWVLKPNATNNNPAAAAAEQEKWERKMAEIRIEFGDLGNPRSKNAMERLVWQVRHAEPRSGPGDGGATQIHRDGVTGTDPEVSAIRPSPESIVGGHITFDAGSAELTADATQSLNQIVPLVRGHLQIVLIKGHTALDDFPDKDPRKQMDLSLRRAQAVSDYLVTNGVEPVILRVQGCSTFEPIADRAYTDQARVPNRRVEVEVTSTLVKEVQPRGQATTQVSLPLDELAR